ncbi:MAG TPA: cytochrome c3 family protein [Hyphomicrobiaceae bacterium]|nr:cytochrome c3 family protein [Hyphomicrobiaceae bacterium]
MTVLFPKWTNKLPAVLALGAAAMGLFVVFAVSFWFSPYHTDVGYQPHQPIAYSHALHAGALGMDCRYCHRMVEEGPHATIPDAETCLGCHRHVMKDSIALKLLRDQAGADARGDGPPIEWVKVHLLPDYAYFNHAVHVRVGVGCASCHGRIDQMEFVRQAEPLSMGWCLECHRDSAAHIRPAGVSVTQMDWVPTEASIAAARRQLEWQGENPPELNPPTHCAACHR